MSLILDALKKAQEERKKITAKMTGNLTTKPAKPRRLVYIVAAGSFCLAVALLLLPSLFKAKPTQPSQVVKMPVVPALTVQSKAPEQTKIVAEAKDASPQAKATVVGGQEKGRGAEKKETKKQEEKKEDRRVVAEQKAEQNFDRQQIADAKARAKKILASVPARPKPDKLDAYSGPPQKVAPAVEETHVVVKKVNDEKLTTMYNEALREVEKGNIEEAKKIYVAILAERPDNVEVLNNLGAIAMKQGSTKEALRHFKKILEYKKDYGKAYNNIGLIMMLDGDKKLAEEYFKKSIEIDKDSVEPCLNLTALLRNEKRFEEASRLLMAALQRGAGNPAIYLSYALIKDEMGQYEDAIKYYRFYLRDGGKSAERNKVIERLKYLEESQFTKIR